MMITQTDTGSLKQVGARRESSLTMWGGFLVTVGAIVALVSASLDFVGDRDIEISLPAVGIAVAGLILWILGKVLARS